MQERRTICIKTTTSVEKLSQVFGEGYMKIMQEAGKAGIQPTGAPYALYLNDDMSNLRIEFGFPADEPPSVPVNGVEAGRLPGGKTAMSVHVGPYDTIEEAYNRLTAFVKERDLEPTGICFEYYLNDPGTTPPEELQTEIYFPLKGEDR
jgi:effector-binding domain-containing protein